MSTNSIPANLPSSIHLNSDSSVTRPNGKAKRAHPLKRWSDRRAICVAPEAHEFAKAQVELGRFQTIGEVFEFGINLMSQQSQATELGNSSSV